MQLRSCEYGALINALKGVSIKRESSNGEDDIFGGSGGGSEAVSATVMGAAKEALARMPVVDVKLMQKKREERSGAMMDGDMMDPFDGGDDGADAPAPASSGGGGEPSLLDLDDIFGGGGAAAPVKQNGSSLPAAAPAPAAQSDVDLLSDIFSAPPAAAPAPAAPALGGFDMFAPQPAAPAPPTQMSSPMMSDPFGASPPPAPMSSPAMSDPFGSSAPVTQPQPTPVAAPTPAAVGGPTPSEVTVQGFSHQGLTVEFKCTKPDTWNKQNSVLVARFINTTDAPLYGLHLQVAVPKHVKMDMKPPTSTTVPVTGGSSTKEVTQTVSITNTMLGTKNLMLKLKAGFTSKGNKVEHMTTCSGFPAGQY